LNELQSILAAWRQLGGDTSEAVLATVVHVKGSAYRRPGGRMLLLPDGQRIGTISGGCLEGDVARKAAWWTSNGESVVRTFDNSAPDVAWDFGLGCNGVISLLIERLDTPAVRESLGFINRQQSTGQECAVATVIRTDPGSPWRIGDRAWRSAAGEAGVSLANSPNAAGLADGLQAALQDRSSRLLHTATADIFVEWIGLPQELVIFGAGHDVIPLVKFASTLGWRITVADNRSAYAHANRFPGAETVVTLPAGGDITGIVINSRTAVVVMTHNYPQDVTLVPQILRRSPRYLGLLGPRRRAENLFRDMGLNITDVDTHAPVGLDIGCDHPETIALSIVAEIQSVLSGRSSGSLRWREGAIHSAVRELGGAELRSFSPGETTALTVCEAVA